ncbi:hypothetical protein CK507_10880 [Pseudomonas sp. WN033]|nr:hypothetical protein CK507_10880 [Pseudomonas sp. WN033]
MYFTDQLKWIVVCNRIWETKVFRIIRIKISVAEVTQYYLLTKNFEQMIFMLTVFKLLQLTRFMATVKARCNFNFCHRFATNGALHFLASSQ